MIERIEIDEEAVLTVAADISSAASRLFSAGSLEDTLAQIIDLSLQTVDGCDYASIYLVEGGLIPSTLQSNRLIAEIDELQFRILEGPSVEASRDRLLHYCPELADDDRWPNYAGEAVKRGVRSQLALPLIAEGTRGSLTLYASYPNAFGVVDRARSLLLASIAAYAYATARTHEDEVRRAENFYMALATRELIGQAQGILMERERITPDQAFAVLCKASQHLNIKLRDIAERLVETGENPEVRPDQRR